VKAEKSGDRRKEKGVLGAGDSAKKVATFDGPAASIVGTQVAPVVAAFLVAAIEVDLLALYILASRFSYFLLSEKIVFLSCCL